MRSTFAGLNTMVSGIQTNRLSLETVGHNISNSATEGYSRQSVNQAATRPQSTYTYYGENFVGSGVGALSLERARDIYADLQYWKENASKGYYEYVSKNYDKVEMIFNDSKNIGIQDSLEKFYSSWVDASTTASTATSRQNVINQGQVFYDRLSNANNQMQNQIIGIYDDMKLTVEHANDLLSQVVDLNKNIMSMEAGGGTANDLRDQRDLIIDELSGIMAVNVYEQSNGMYDVVCNGTTLVNGIAKITLEMSSAVYNPDYGISDFALHIKETQVGFFPTSGQLQAQYDSIKEDKEYMDYIASMAAFCLSSLNEQHRAGAGIDTNTTTGINFYGENGYHYTWDSDNNRLVKTKCVVEMNYTDGSVVTDGVTTTAPTDPDKGHTLLSVTYTDSTNPADTSYLRGVNILSEMFVNPMLLENDIGQTYLATRSLTYDVNGTLNSNLIYPKNGTYNIAPSGINGTGDGTNAVNVSVLFNSDLRNSAEADVVNLMNQLTGITDYRRSIGDVSLYAYYNTQMTTMGSRAEAADYSSAFQADIIIQIYNLRQSTAGVNWDEELSNMIMFQQGYSACSRCLTTMDEMLDKLINGTGVVGR